MDLDLVEDVIEDDIEPHVEAAPAKRVYNRKMPKDVIVPLTPIERARALEREVEVLHEQVADLKTGLARQIQLTEHERRRANSLEAAAGMAWRAFARTSPRNPLSRRRGS